MLPIRTHPGGKIIIDSLSVTHPSRQSSIKALENVTFDVNPEELVAILGPSGSGKTTLLRTIGDLIAPTSGRILIDGLAPANARMRRWFGFVPQSPTLLPNRTVAGNISLPLEIVGEKNSSAVDFTLDLVGLTEFRNAYPDELSGGMQQRTALARALVLSPRILLMDEPFSALDELLRESLCVEFSLIQRQLRQTVVFVTHSVEEAVFLADRIIILSSRPGTIRYIVQVNLPPERKENLRFDGMFLDEVIHIRSLIRSK